MKAILIIVLGIAAALFVLTHYLNKSLGFKPVLPTVYFEDPGDSQQILIDFSSCQPEQAVISGAFGSAKIEKWSADVNSCNFDYAYSGGNKANCLVPKTTGTLRFKKTSEEIDFSQIASYCK